MQVDEPIVDVVPAGHTAHEVLETRYIPAAQEYCMGPAEGAAVGNTEGVAVGDNVGNTEGVAVGVFVGGNVGAAVGDLEGVAVGVFVGSNVGAAVGNTEGLAVGGTVDAARQLVELLEEYGASRGQLAHALIEEAPVLCENVPAGHLVQAPTLEELDALL